MNVGDIKNFLTNESKVINYALLAIDALEKQSEQQIAKIKELEDKLKEKSKDK